MNQGAITVCITRKYQTTQVGIPNPNGIPSLSPGLRGTSYPGLIGTGIFNPNGVVSFGSRRCSVTPLGLKDQSNYTPRVVAPLQPWAECHSRTARKKRSARIRQLTPRINPASILRNMECRSEPSSVKAKLKNLQKFY